MNGYAHRTMLRSSIKPNNPQEDPEIPQSHTFLMLELDLTMMILMEAPLQEVWDRMMRDLERGARDRNDALHTFAFSSLSLQGSPATRTVVLRAFEKKRRCIRFHSDLRSTKIQELKRDPRVSALFYHPAEKTQIRAEGMVVLHENDAIADQLWEHLWVLGRRCYMAPRAPGSLAKAPSPNLPTEWMDRKPTLEASESGRANFCVIEFTLSYMEWLELGFEGHTRACYHWSEEGNQWKGCWLEP